MLRVGVILLLAAVLPALVRGQGGFAIPDHALNVSWGDQVVIGKGAARLDTPAHIREALSAWQAGSRSSTVYWRLCSWTIENDCEKREKGAEWYFARVREAEAHGDTLAAALQACRALGLRLLGYITVFDEGSPASVLYGDRAPFPWQSHFTIAHPEFLVCSRDGRTQQHGVMEYAYPEVRRYKIDQIRRFLDAYDYDGIYVCTRSHSPVADQADQYGFNEPVAAEFQRRFGVDPRRQDFDLQAWRDLRGEGFTLFLRELRAELNRRGKRLALGIPRGDVFGPPYGNLTLHWRQWVAERLVDELVVGVQSGHFHYPSQRGRDRERGYLASGDEGFGLRPLAEDIREHYAPLCRANGVILRLAGTLLFPPAPELAGCMLDAGSLSNCFLDIALPPHEALDLQSPAAAVSFQLWPETADGWPRLLCKYNHTLGDAGRGWEIFLDEEGRVVFRLAADGQDVHVRSAAPVPLRTWSRVSCGFPAVGAPIEIRLDGELSVERTIPAFLPRVVPVPLAVGRYAGGGRPFSGRLCDIRIHRCPPRPATVANAAQVALALTAGRDPEGPAAAIAVPAGMPLLWRGIGRNTLADGPEDGLVALVFGVRAEP